MATAYSFISEVDDSVTCGVCLCEYDAVLRRPKFLQCSHTICLVCLQTIGSEGRIICPFCRNTFIIANGVASLPNNSHALRLLELTEENRKDDPVETKPMVVNWCLTCKSAEKPQCGLSGHLYINMAADTIRPMDSLLNLKEELLKIKEKGNNNLAMAIAKRQEVHLKLIHILKSITVAGDQVRKLLDENSALLTEMVSSVEKTRSNSRTTQTKVEKNFFLQELLDLVDDSSPNDTPEIFKTKMVKYNENSKKKLDEATNLSSDLNSQQKIRIVVKLYDENDRWIPTCQLLDSLKDSVSNQPRKKIILNSDSLKKAESKTALLPLPISNKCIPSQSIFVLKLFKTGTPVGEVHFRPDSSTFSSEFTQKLGDFCYNSPKEFANPIEKAKSGVYVLLQLIPKQFHTSITNYKNLNTITKVSDVGVVLVELVTGPNKEIVGWKFLFPLQDFRDPKDKKAVSSLPVTQILGHIIDPEMVKHIDKLGATKKSDRLDYRLTLELRPAI